MTENGPNYSRILENSKKVFIKESGARNRKEVLEVKPEETDDLEGFEPREFARDLQNRAIKLLELYRNTYNFSAKKKTSETSIDYLFARLDPNSVQYVEAHLIELDAFAARAEFEPRLLPMAAKAVEAWEHLQGKLPSDFINDGLRLDAHAVIDLKKYIEGFKSQLTQPGQKDKAIYVLDNLRKKYPVIMDLIESIKDFDVSGEQYEGKN